MQKIVIFPTAQEAVTQIAEDFVALSLENRPVHLSLSGGSTPTLLFKTLAEPPFKDAIQWQNLHFWWGDERMVESTSPESNYGEVERTLFRHIPIPKENLHPILGTGNHEDALKNFCHEMKANIPNLAFDWIILGMGEDGHTASLFPGQMAKEAQDLAILAQHPATGQWRISKTLRLIEKAKRVTFLVTGENKAQVVAEILDNTPNAKNYPAFYAKGQNGQEWYLDEKASFIWQQRAK